MKKSALLKHNVKKLSGKKKWLKKQQSKLARRRKQRENSKNFRKKELLENSSAKIICKSLNLTSNVKLNRNGNKKKN